MEITGIVTLASRLLNKDSKEGQDSSGSAKQAKKASTGVETQQLEDQFTPSVQYEADAGLFQVPGHSVVWGAPGPLPSGSVLRNAEQDGASKAAAFFQEAAPQAATEAAAQPIAQAKAAGA